jgi:PAS domain S-box-containing protein
MLGVSISPIRPRSTPDKPGGETEALLAIINDIGNIVAATPKFCDLCAYSPEEISFQNWWIDLTPSESIASELRVLGEISAREGLQFFDKELVRANGEKLRIGVLARAFHGGFMLEIARTLPCQSSDERPLYCFSEVISIEQASLVTDGKGGILHINERALSFLHCQTEKEVIGRSAFDFIAPEYSADFKRCIAGEHTGIPSEDIIGVRRHDGETARVYFRSLPLFSHGKFSGTIGFFKAARNGTIGLRAPRAAAPVSPPCGPLACLNGFPAALCSLRPDGSIRFVNAFGRSFLGIGDEDMHRGIFIFERLREGMVGRCRALLDDVLCGAEIRPIVMDVETPEGEYRPAIWCFAWDRERDGLICVILQASNLLASIMLPDEGFYASYGLTSREREVADLLILGFEYKEIADRIGVSLPTVRSHTQGVYSRLGIHSRTELIELAGKWCGMQDNDELHDIITRCLRRR